MAKVVPAQGIEFQPRGKMTGNRKSDNEPIFGGYMSADSDPANSHEVSHISPQAETGGSRSLNTSIDSLSDIGFDPRNHQDGEPGADPEFNQSDFVTTTAYSDYSPGHVEADQNALQYNYSSEKMSQQLDHYSGYDSLNESSQENDIWRWLKSIKIYFDGTLVHLKDSMNLRLETTREYFEELHNNYLGQKDRLLHSFDEAVAQVKDYFQHKDSDKEGNKTQKNHVVSYNKDNELLGVNQGNVQEDRPRSEVDSVYVPVEHNSGWKWIVSTHAFYEELREKLREKKNRALNKFDDMYVKAKEYFHPTAVDHAKGHTAEDLRSEQAGKNIDDLNTRISLFVDQSKKTLSQIFVVPQFLLDLRGWFAGLWRDLKHTSSKFFHAIDEKSRKLPSGLDLIITKIYNWISRLFELARFYQKQLLWFFVAISITAAGYGLFVLDNGNIISEKTLMSLFNSSKVSSISNSGGRASVNTSGAAANLGSYPSKPGQKALSALPSKKSKVVTAAPKPSLEAMAKTGDAKSQFEFGSKLINQSGADNDNKTGVEWIKKSAEQGYAPAQTRLGTIYEEGALEKRDLVRAENLYKSAADAGNAQAMHNLAVVLSKSTGRKNSLGQSLGWFKEAASYGVKDSQYNLGLIYANGIGVKPDWVEAYKWLDLAASQGDKEAAKLRDSIGRRMLLEQIDSAKESSREFVAKTPNPKTNYIASKNDVGQ